MNYSSVTVPTVITSLHRLKCTSKALKFCIHISLWSMGYCCHAHIWSQQIVILCIGVFSGMMVGNRTILPAILEHPWSVVTSAGDFICPLITPSCTLLQNSVFGINRFAIFVTIAFVGIFYEVGGCPSFGILPTTQCSLRYVFLVK